MARIRSVKPEFHGDERLARDLTREQRLFYQGMWNEADDEGRLRANSRKLLGAIYPYEDDLDETFVDGVLIRLAETGRAVLYVIGGEKICQLTKFSKHQTINKPSPSKLPPPPKKVASVLGWLYRNGTGSLPGGLPEDSRGEVEVEVEVEGNREQGEGVGSRAREGSPAADFTPNPDHRAFCSARGLDVGLELVGFMAWNEVHHGDVSDATFTLWLTRAVQFANGNGAGGGLGSAAPPPGVRPPPVYQPPTDEPEPTPEQREAGLALVRAAAAAVPGPKRNRLGPRPPSEIDDPDVIARREQAKRDGLAAARGGDPHRRGRP